MHEPQYVYTIIPVNARTLLAMNENMNDKRARMSTQDVIDAIYSDDDDFDVDDPDEPFMEGMMIFRTWMEFDDEGYEIWTRI